MSTVSGPYKRRRHLRCTNVWILCLEMSHIPRRWMMIENLLDRLVKFQPAIMSWKARHPLAREALLHSLEPTDMLKIIPHRDSAPMLLLPVEPENITLLKFCQMQPLLWMQKILFRQCQKFQTSQNLNSLSENDFIEAHPHCLLY